MLQVAEGAQLWWLRAQTSQKEGQLAPARPSRHCAAAVSHASTHWTCLWTWGGRPGRKGSVEAAARREVRTRRPTALA
jgi:hypothetical protein